ncbi:hypothetical protein, partial [Oleiphilus sp. HI0123]|uniref:hypothetical protein n=1 Tax=Oleiphilus sp. HI0123 TaxID=1822265 RepID=UPI000A89B65D
IYVHDGSTLKATITPDKSSISGDRGVLIGIHSIASDNTDIEGFDGSYAAVVKFGYSFIRDVILK